MPLTIDIIAVIPTVVDNGAYVSDAFSTPISGSIGGVGIAGGNIVGAFFLHS